MSSLPCRSPTRVRCGLPIPLSQAAGAISQIPVQFEISTGIVCKSVFTRQDIEKSELLISRRSQHSLTSEETEIIALAELLMTRGSFRPFIIPELEPSPESTVQPFFISSSGNIIVRRL